MNQLRSRMVGEVGCYGRMLSQLRSRMVGEVGCNGRMMSQLRSRTLTLDFPCTTAPPRRTTTHHMHNCTTPPHHHAPPLLRHNAFCHTVAYTPRTNTQALLTGDMHRAPQAMHTTSSKDRIERLAASACPLPPYQDAAAGGGGAEGEWVQLMTPRTPQLYVGDLPPPIPPHHRTPPFPPDHHTPSPPPPPHRRPEGARLLGPNPNGGSSTRSSEWSPLFEDVVVVVVRGEGRESFEARCSLPLALTITITLAETPTPTPNPTLTLTIS
jgi:hypothetical protein